MDANCKTKTLKELSIASTDDPAKPEMNAVFVCGQCDRTICVLRPGDCTDMECCAFVCCGVPMVSAN